MAIEKFDQTYSYLDSRSITTSFSYLGRFFKSRKKVQVTSVEEPWKKATYDRYLREQIFLFYA